METTKHQYHDACLKSTLLCDTADIMKKNVQVAMFVV
jgi:hypothetical protein